MSKPNIVFVGHVVIDRNRVEHEAYETWGSPGMFMTKYFAAKFDIKPTIIASYGPDFLRYAGGAKLVPNKPNLPESMIYQNIVIHGRRTQYCHNPNIALPPIDDEVKAVLAQADLLFLAPLTPGFTVDYVAEIMTAVRNTCLKVLLPQGYLRRIGHDDLVWPRDFEEAADILPHFNVAVISNEDHLHADAEAQKWKRLSPQTEIIVTQNVEGADIITENGVTNIPTTPVPEAQVVDPVGLGDVFGAALGYDLFLHDDLPTAVKAANAAAREKLMSPREF